MKKIICLLSGLLIGGSILIAQQAPTRQDTLKGANTPEKAWWKLVHFDLTVEPDYVNQTIAGKNSIEYAVLKSHQTRLQLDLLAPLHIDSVFANGRKLAFQQDGNAWFITVPLQRPGSKGIVEVCYSGKPRVSVKPPWDGGVVWTHDSLGRPWMAVACQLSSPYVWYPCKADLHEKLTNGMTIAIIVPDTLVAVANGRMLEKTSAGEHRTRYHWQVKSPINNYGTTFYIGKYVHVADRYSGEKGTLDMDFWVIDYNEAKVTSYLIPEVHATFPSFERWYGPYPFYTDGFKMVESPYIGMEHQSAVGYGNHFEHGRYGSKILTYWDHQTDRMVVHENAHEWFGNSITASDPADRWLQEGFAGYAEELVMEDRYGKKAAAEFFLARTTGRISNDRPVISRYGIWEDAGDDMYLKGWVVIHMIRAMLQDDEKFKRLLRGLSSSFYHQTVTSARIEAYIDSATGLPLRPVFDEYLRTTQIPVLEYKNSNEQLSFRFSNCADGFTMPIGTNWTGRITPTTSWQTVAMVKSGDSLRVDPDFYVTVKKVD